MVLASFTGGTILYREQGHLNIVKVVTKRVKVIGL